MEAELDDQRGRGQHGDGHAGHAEDVAADRGGGVRQALQGLDEADAGDQVQQRDEVHAHAGCSFLFGGVGLGRTLFS
jgi:hypothetical protein